MSSPVIISRLMTKAHFLQRGFNPPVPPFIIIFLNKYLVVPITDEVLNKKSSHVCYFEVLFKFTGAGKSEHAGSTVR